MFVVGSEGLIGCCFFAVLLPVFSKIECTGKLCHNGYLENMGQVFDEFKNNRPLVIQTVIIFTMIAIYNIAGITITKYASSAQRSTVDASKSLLIWLVLIYLGKEKFIWGELLGFIFLVLGTLIYNEIIEVPIKIMRIPKKEEKETEGKSV